MPTFKNEVNKANQVAIVGLSKKYHGVTGESSADGAGVIGISDSGEGVSGFSTPSCLTAANPMNSMRTTYRPRGNPLNTNAPFVAETVEYFFPVRVFAAVTVTPGNNVLPFFTVPEIS